jgi:hypothetical protein
MMTIMEPAEWYDARKINQLSERGGLFDALTAKGSGCQLFSLNAQRVAYNFLQQKFSLQNFNEQTADSL